MNYTGRPSISGCRPVLSLYPTHRFCQYLLLIFITFTNSFLFNRAFSTNSRRPLRHAAGVTALDSTSPSRLTPCHLPYRGEALAVRKAQKNPLSEIAAPGGGLSFWVSQWTRLLPHLPSLLYAIPRKSQALCGKFTVTLLLASPVSFWRIICYNGFAVHPAYLTGEEVDALAYFLTFLVSVGADVVSHFICKWLDRCEENRKA